MNIMKKILMRGGMLLGISLVLAFSIQGMNVEESHASSAIDITNYDLGGNVVANYDYGDRTLTISGDGQMERDNWMAMVHLMVNGSNVDQIWEDESLVEHIKFESSTTGKIIFPVDSSQMFENYGGETIDFGSDDIDTSNVTNMSKLFKGTKKFNDPIGELNTQNVTNMSHMFDGSLKFNQPITTLNFSKVDDMSYMYANCAEFNQIIDRRANNTYRVFSSLSTPRWNAFCLLLNCPKYEKNIFCGTGIAENSLRFTTPDKAFDLGPAAPGVKPISVKYEHMYTNYTGSVPFSRSGARIKTAELGSFYRLEINEFSDDYLVFLLDSYGFGKYFMDAKKANERFVFEARKSTPPSSIPAERWPSDGRYRGHWLITQGIALKFDKNGAQGPKPISKTSESKPKTFYVINQGGIYKTGFDFIGWNTEADGSGDWYQPTEQITINESTTLYAQWGNKIEYFGNGNTSGTAPTPESGVENQQKTIKDKGDLEKTGRVFDGWNTQANGNGAIYQPGSQYTFGSSLKLYAQWKYKIEYFGNGNTGGTAPAEQTAEENETVIIKDKGNLVKDGCEFIGWNTEPDGTGIHFDQGNNYTFSLSNPSRKLYAQWRYKIEYRGNGHDTGTAPTKQVGQSGETVQIKDKGTLTKNDARFIGWNTKADGTGTNYTAGTNYTFSPSNPSIDLYAQWEYEIQYNGNGNTGGTAPSKQVGIAGTNISVKAGTGLVKNTNNFVRWNTKADGSGIDYMPGDSIALNANIKLYAQYGYKLVYDGNGNTAGIVPTKQVGGTGIIVKSGTGLVKNTNNFVCWNEKADGSGINYEDGDIINLTKDTTLYAQYGYKLVYDGNGNTGGPSKTIKAGESGTTVTIKSGTGLSKTGKRFDKWNTKADGTGTDYTVGSSYTFVSDLTLYAQWKNIPSSGGSGSSGRRRRPKPITPIEPEPELEIELKFDDVPENEWYYDAVYDVAKKGLMNGTGERIFEPNSGTTRGMIITTLFRLSREPKIEFQHNFPDVPENEWYTDAVKWGTKKGIILGYEEGNFGPDDIITRQQLVAMIYRFSKYKGYDTTGRMNLSGFEDEQEMYDYAKEPFEWTVSTGLIEGVGYNLLAPTLGTERAELAMLLSRYSNRYGISIEASKKK